MLVPADAKIWGSLLSACRSHGDVETAVVAAERLVELEPGDVGNLMMLANVYAAAGRWGDVARTRKEIRSRSTRKTPGCSMIEVDNVVREFVAGEDLGPELGGPAAVLDILASQLAADDEDSLIQISVLIFKNVRMEQRLPGLQPPDHATDESSPIGDLEKIWRDSDIYPGVNSDIAKP
ncbi:Pentatricopeptide repeat-containing protein [Dichanthelium oligosanthes]|uniref:Pentatricopeptide repeat-containing protein n=1 Tax=Dichanthelium oligosanthes TaxID=888268 RepID=A0A1E5WEI1_9POAL|nr:Pentatricopeptide repeat-containing protein [Dichanthelium oligosanthes]